MLVSAYPEHVSASTEPVQVRWLGQVRFSEAWELQREIHESVVAGDMPDTLLLLEHESVYTAGRRTQPEDRPLDGTPVIDVDRGGRITWHGPGQLVGYPVVHLQQPMDVVSYVRQLEELLIITAARFGVEGQRIDGRSGVWVEATPARKIAAIGVRVARDVTMHGFALNVNCDLSAYDRIVPCGIRDAGVTSLHHETGAPVEVSEVADEVSALAGILHARRTPA
jgi:lipoyl(octanoyl) transferase